MTTRRSQTANSAAASQPTKSTEDKNATEKVIKYCCFCNHPEGNELDLGKFYEYNGIVTHYYCLLLSSNMEQRGEDEEGILGFLVEDIQKEIKRGRKLQCSYCKRSGATLGCYNARCKTVFHLPCGLKSGSLHHFFGEFKSFCSKHRPQVSIDERILQEALGGDKKVCYVCYENVNPRDNLKTLWAPCCKKNAWFHKRCIQQLAMSAGYFFKCPLCNSKEEFQNAMLEYGIFIPCQDASWELVPNAYQELLYRHNRCDAKNCSCPKGRSYMSGNTKWELTLCSLCGSQGIHNECGNLKWGSNSRWECSECIAIVHKKNDANIPTNQITQEEDSSSDSDSDISVGNEMSLIPPQPIRSKPGPRFSKFLTRPICSKPGPRSFKLLQARMAGSCHVTLPTVSSERSSEELDSSSSSSKMSSTAGESSNSTSSSILSNKSARENLIKSNSENTQTKTPTKPSKSLAEVIMLDSDEDDGGIQIVSESISPKEKDNEAYEQLKKILISPSFTKSTDKAKPVITASVIVNEPTCSLNNVDMLDSVPPIASDFNPQICNVTSVPPEWHEQMPDSSTPLNSFNPEVSGTVNLSIADINPGVLHRKRQHMHEKNGDSQNIQIKRRFVETNQHYIVNGGNWEHNSETRMKPMFYQKEGSGAAGFSERTNVTSREWLVPATDARNINTLNTNGQMEMDRCILQQAIQNAGINCSPNTHNHRMLVFNQVNLPLADQRLNYSQNSKAIQELGDVGAVFCITNQTLPQDTTSQKCDGDAGIVVVAGPEVSTDSFPGGERSAEEFNSDSGNVQQSTSGNDDCCSRVDTITLSDGESDEVKSGVSGSTCDRSRLINQKINIRDLKFTVRGRNLVEVALYDEYKINLKAGNTNKQKAKKRLRGPRCRRAMLSDSTDDEAVLFESVTVVGMLEDAKENLKPSRVFHPSKDATSAEDPLSNSRFESRNIEDSNSGNQIPCDWEASSEPETIASKSSGKKSKFSVNCRVSIELAKIENFINSSLLLAKRSTNQRN